MLAQNAGKVGEMVVHDVLTAQRVSENFWTGWDALQNEIRDLGADPPIMDPTQVAISVISAAGSAASTILTTEVSITDLNR